MKRASFCLLLLIAAAPLIGQMKPPRLEKERLIYDYARILDAEARESLLKIIWPLAKVHRPIVILTVNKLADWGATPEKALDFTTLTYNQWGLGSRASDNMGALVMVAKDDRRVAISVGEGSTGYRQDLTASIISDIMGPNFKDGDYAGGLREGAIAIRDRIFQPKTNDDLSALPYEGAPASASGSGSGSGSGSASGSGSGSGTSPNQSPGPTPTGPTDIGLPGPGSPGTGSGGPAMPPPRDHTPGRPQTGPGFPKPTNLHFQCGRWFCIAIGALVLLSLFRRRRQQPYGYGPQYGPQSGPPPGYGYRNYGGGGGFGGMLGGILTGMLINNIGRRHSSGGGNWGSSGGGGSVFGGGGDSGGGGGGGFGGGGGGGGGGDSGAYGGGSSGGGAAGSW